MLFCCATHKNSLYSLWFIVWKNGTWYLCVCIMFSCQWNKQNNQESYSLVRDFWVFFYMHFAHLLSTKEEVNQKKRKEKQEKPLSCLNLFCLFCRFHLKRRWCTKHHKQRWTGWRRGNVVFTWSTWSQMSFEHVFFVLQ